jgi:DNA polymerase-3 subunit delta'
VEHLAGRADQAPEQARLLAALSGGSLGRAIELAQSKDLARLRAQAQLLADEIWSLDALGILEKAEALDKQKQEMPRLLDLLALEMRDRIHRAQEGAPRPGSEVKPARESPGTRGLNSYLTAVEAIERTRLNLSKNANARLSLEALLFRLFMTR